MDIKKLTNKQLTGAINALADAKAHRPGGLLVTEEKALQTLQLELVNRILEN